MATTALISEQKTILWRIPNFAEVLKSAELLREQHFKFAMTLGVTPTRVVAPLKWTCWLQTVEGKAEYKDRVGVFLSIAGQVPAELSQCHAKVALQIAPKGQPDYFLDTAISKSLEEYTKGGYGSYNGFPLASETTPFLNEDGAVEIQVTVTVYLPESLNPKLAGLEAEFKHHFTKNLRYSLDDLRYGTSRDTKILAKDGVEIPVNRVLLSGRSSVFRAMFESNMSESQSGLVEVKDMDSKPLEVLLHFIHTGELVNNWKNEGVIEGLVYGAHKYLMDDLLEFLDEVLAEVCTDGNCGKLTGLAKTFGLKNAEKQLFDYFKKNLAKDLDEVLKFAEETTMAAITQPESEEQESGTVGAQDIKKD